MVSAMKTLWIAAWLASGVICAAAAETDAGTLAQEISDVESAIPAAVKAIGAPTMVDFSSGIQMAVSASTEKAQAHVVQGLNHLHGGWEFEASRHFAAAMREDPDCLLAYWGMAMALINPSPETNEARSAATDRMLDLIEHGTGTELEKGYVYGLMKYIEDGPTGASIAFRKVADRFPNELQSGIFSALFSRGGFDAAGDATPDQLASEKVIETLITKYPDNPATINALLTIRAEGADLTKSLELARNLSRMMPNYAPVCHLLGHYEWRCGNLHAASAAFERASALYQRWMDDNKVGIADCPEWIKAECYRIVALVSQGQFDAAYTAAQKVAAIPVPTERPSSAGARFLMWEAQSLPARVLLYRNRSPRGIAEEAAQSLPKTEDLRQFRNSSLAYWWIDGLRFALEAQRLIDADKIDEARDVMAALTQHGELMSKTQEAAAANGERSQWLRAFRSLEVLASDIRGRLAMAGPLDKRETAYNWFASAMDRQQSSPMLYPPMVLSPMASRLGNFYLATKKPTEAIEYYQRALTSFPNDNQSLIGLKAAFEVAGKSAEATEIEQQIEKLRQK
jgi:tetratricopeptide (TPR) repeat protein